MGIGPFRWDGWRARSGGFALGFVAAVLVFGGGVPPLAFAAGAGPAIHEVQGQATARTESHGSTLPRSTAAGSTARPAAVQSVQKRSAATLDATVVGLASDSNGGGYWEVASDGGLFAAGNAPFHGSVAVRTLATHVVSVVADPATGGYWEVAKNGGVFSFDAPFYGSMGGHRLAKPIVGMAATPDGKGYWEVAADGGIFSFGDARFHGSMGGHRLAKPIVGMAATPNGKGYWEVAADGGIFSFGDARFHGSMGGHRLRKPIVGMAATPNGKGYWEVAADGGIFSFGDARFHGSLGGKSIKSRIAGLTATPQGKGYWEVASDGAIYSFGRAQFAGAARVALPARVAPPARIYLPPSNPPENIAPVPAYTFQSGGTYSASSSLPCWQLGTSAWIPLVDGQCIAAEIAATNNAHAEEGLPSIRLPSTFASLTSEEQLFVLNDIERVSRGEQPVAGLSSLVDGYAQAGAETGDDPQFDFGAIPSSDWWGSNVVSGALNALDANYTWMYADGYGGYNVDCPSRSSSGCWGHRDNELTSNYGGTLVMGAGDYEQRTGLQSLSELFVVVQDPGDLPPLYYTWAQAVAAGAAG